MSTTDLAPAFFLAVVAILVACRVTSRLLRPLRQPPVVGEMVAGVLLGPSVLGLIAPGVEHGLFPAEVRPVLYVVGQIGLVVFMFQSGYELRIGKFRSLAGSAGLIAAAGIVVPALLGAALAWSAHGWFDVRMPGVPAAATVAFVGVSIAITAFPMMARIITERGLAGSRFGSVALTAGAIDDAVAWILLAVVLSMASARFGPAVLAVGGSVVFVGLLLAARSVLHRVFAARVSAEQLLLTSVAVLLLSAWYTDRIGLYAVFGAFALGVAFPRTARADQVLETIAPVCRIVFLPLFFTYSGLNTDFGLLNGIPVLLFTLGCLLVAIVGKLGACTGAALLVGEPPAVAVRIGALMNARGLMQLIALNVGLAAGIVSAQIFTVLVLVALVTTMMAAPMLAWLDRADRRRGRDPDRLLRDPGPGAEPVPQEALSGQ